MLDKSDSDSQPYLEAGPRVFERLDGVSDYGLLLIADHAGRALPEGYGDLGIQAAQFERHIAYDIGVREVTEHLNSLMGVPAIMGIYSRLFIDLNRGTDDPTLIMKLSDGALVPGNLEVDEREKARRIEKYYAPYHRTIDEMIDASIAAQQDPVLISVHSFTPNWRGFERPWHASVLWDSDDRLVRPLLRRLCEEEGLTIGDNVPYSGELEGDCLNQHGTRRGIAHALIEIRQDLIADSGGQRAWAERLARILEDVMRDETFRNSLNCRRSL